jgi:hypothetical protein
MVRFYPKIEPVEITDEIFIHTLDGYVMNFSKRDPRPDFIEAGPNTPAEAIFHYLEEQGFTREQISFGEQKVIDFVKEDLKSVGITDFHYKE